MRRTILAAAVLSLSMLASPANAAPADSVFPRGLPHAPSKHWCYSYRCVWDGQHQGNWKGKSFILTRWEGGYLAKPIRHRRAHRLQAAFCARPNVDCRGYHD